MESLELGIHIVTIVQQVIHIVIIQLQVILIVLIMILQLVEQKILYWQHLMVVMELQHSEV